jgi:hypothetical protein
MTLPTNISGNEGGGSVPGGAPAPIFTKLEAWLQEMHYCEECKSEQIFCAGWECSAGYVGVCLGCRQPKLAAWTRTNGEAA